MSDMQISAAARQYSAPVASNSVLQFNSSSVSAKAITESSAADKTREAPNRNEVESAAKAVEKFVSSQGNQLNFTIDEDLGETIVKVIDPSTKEVLRQIPSEEMVSMAKALDQLKGLLVNNKA